MFDLPFRVHTVNHIGPNSRFQWRVLPQGMANSPTPGQRYVAQTIDTFRFRYPAAYIIHYVDDLLIAAATLWEATVILQEIALELQKRGFTIAPENIQTTYRFLFLGFRLDSASVFSQKLAISIGTCGTCYS